jgi:hypothetical protein
MRLRRMNRNPATIRIPVVALSIALNVGKKLMDIRGAKHFQGRLWVGALVGTKYYCGVIQRVGFDALRFCYSPACSLRPCIFLKR